MYLYLSKIRVYFSSIRYHVLLSFILFSTSLLLGYLSPGITSFSFLEQFRELFGFTRDFSSIELLLFIFLNNSVKSFFVILLGTIFGFAPLAFITFNGFVIGFISYELTRYGGMMFIIAGFVPHGIVEIPVFILSTAIGFRMGHELVNRVRGEGNIRDEMIRGMHIYFSFILPLLFLAAVIEAFVTPAILSATGVLP